MINLSVEIVQKMDFVYSPTFNIMPFEKQKEFIESLGNDIFHFVNKNFFKINAVQAKIECFLDAQGSPYSEIKRDRIHLRNLDYSQHINKMYLLSDLVHETLHQCQKYFCKYTDIKSGTYLAAFKYNVMHEKCFPWIHQQRTHLQIKTKCESYVDLKKIGYSNHANYVYQAQPAECQVTSLSAQVLNSFMKQSQNIDPMFIDMVVNIRNNLQQAQTAFQKQLMTMIGCVKEILNIHEGTCYSVNSNIENVFKTMLSAQMTNNKVRKIINESCLSISNENYDQEYDVLKDVITSPRHLDEFAKQNWLASAEDSLLNAASLNRLSPEQGILTIGDQQYKISQEEAEQILFILGENREEINRYFELE